MKKTLKCKVSLNVLLKNDEPTKRKAESMLKRLRPLEDWMEDDETMEVVKRVFGDPVEFYEKLKNNIAALTK